ncbi:MAG: DUF4349 domain-containing protein [Bacteroidota bacterium]
MSKCFWLIGLLGTLASCTTYRAATVNASPVVAQVATGTEQDRKLIYAAHLVLSAPEPDTVINRIITLAENYGGNIVATDGQQATIRVPVQRFTAALEEVETFGKLKDKRIMGEDVTDEYRDYAIRLDNAERSRQRYLELLDLAKNVEEAITVERELERLNETIDLLKGRLNRLEQLEAYGTISVYVNKKAKLGPLGAIFKGLYSGVRWLFVR